MGYIGSKIGSFFGGGLGALIGSANSGADIGSKIGESWLPFKKGGKVHKLKRAPKKRKAKK